MDDYLPTSNRSAITTNQPRRSNARHTEPNNHSCASYGRRCKSESQATPVQADVNNDLLANIAAIQLLSGCMPLPRKCILSENRHSVDLFNGKAEGLPRLTLHMVSTLSVQVHRGDSCTGLGRQSSKFFDEDHLARETDADGYLSILSEDSSPRHIKAAKSIAVPGSLEDELNRRLQSIDEALCLREGKRERRRRKLCTSEVSRTEDSQNMNDSTTQSGVQAEKLNLWCTSQCGDVKKHFSKSDELMDKRYLLDSMSEVGHLSLSISYKQLQSLWFLADMAFRLDAHSLVEL